MCFKLNVSSFGSTRTLLLVNWTQSLAKRTLGGGLDFLKEPSPKQLLLFVFAFCSSLPSKCVYIESILPSLDLDGSGSKKRKETRVTRRSSHERAVAKPPSAAASTDGAVTDLSVTPTSSRNVPDGEILHCIGNDVNVVRRISRFAVRQTL